MALASTGIGAPAAAMLIGGGTGLATGSVEKGLMAGLGAYGGAGIGEGLAASATTPIEQAATAQSTVNAANAGVIPQAPGAATPGGLNAVNSFDTGAVSQAMAPPPPAGAPVDFGISTAGGQTQAPLEFTQQTPNMSTADAMKTIGKAGNVPTGPQSGYSFDQLKSGYANTDLGQFAADNYGKIGMAAAPVLSAAMEPKPYENPEEEYGIGYRLSPNFQGYTPRRPNPYYTPRGLGYASGGEVESYARGGFMGLIDKMFGRDKQSDVPGLSKDFQGYYGAQPLEYYTPKGLGYAGGGIMDIAMARGGSFDDEPGMDGYAEGGTPKKPAKAKMTGARNIASMDPYEAAMAELNNARAGGNLSQMTMPKAGLAELGALPYAAGGMAAGRYLSGGGDGMSDSIPATINNKQPARLADGEFVVPADVVSHLGNGSSNAGAKKLYGMMDKIRTARTGKKKQAPAVKTNKYLPV
jgi:hypothetical protein